MIELPALVAFRFIGFSLAALQATRVEFYENYAQTAPANGKIFNNFESPNFPSGFNRWSIDATMPTPTQFTAIAYRFMGWRRIDCWNKCGNFDVGSAPSANQ